MIHDSCNHHDHDYKLYLSLAGFTLSVDFGHCGSKGYRRVGDRSPEVESCSAWLAASTVWVAHMPDTGPRRWAQASDGHHFQEAVRCPPGTRWTWPARPRAAWALGWEQKWGDRNEGSVFTLPFHCCFSLSSVTAVTSSHVLRWCYFIWYHFTITLQCKSFSWCWDPSRTMKH